MQLTNDTARSHIHRYQDARHEEDKASGWYPALDQGG